MRLGTVDVELAAVDRLHLVARLDGLGEVGEGAVEQRLDLLHQGMARTIALRFGRRLQRLAQVGFQMPGRQQAARIVALDVEQQVAPQVDDRSEEHTSELQSLMRISYAVFCLKKKKSLQNVNCQRNQHKVKRA